MGISGRIVRIVFFSSALLLGTSPVVFSQTHQPSRSEVRQIQTALVQIGFDPGRIDGIAGAKTKKAIADFQRLYGLEASGIIDQLTQITLGSALVQQRTEAEGNSHETSNVQNPELEQPQYVPPVPAEIYPPETEEYRWAPGEALPGVGDANMGIGMASVIDDIRNAQMALRNQGFDPGDLNGLLNSQTRDAVRRFQAANNLPVTGNFDARTQAALGVTVRGTSNPDTFHD